MANFTIKVKGLIELQRAIKRNPKTTIREIQNFLVRGIAKYKSQINSNPWKVGQSGRKRGVPVDTSNLRQLHQTIFEKYKARIFPRNVKYARWVHDGTRVMRERPWLDQAKDDQEPKINELADQMLKNIVSALAK